MDSKIIVAVVLFAVSSAWSVFYAGITPRLSISQHVAKLRVTRWVFGVATLTSTILAGATIFGDILPGYHPSALLYCIFCLLIIQFIFTALFPHVAGTWQGTIHNIAAWGICFTVPFATAATLLLPLEPWLFNILLGALVVEIVLLTVALSFKTQRSYFLIYQSVYLAVFFGVLLVLAKSAT